MTTSVIIGGRSLEEWSQKTRVNIKPALEQAIVGVAACVFGENLHWEVSYKKIGSVTDGVQMYSVTAQAQTYSGEECCVIAEIPVRQPDMDVLSWRVDDRVFAVTANAWAHNLKITAWTEYNPYNGALTIVHSEHPDVRRWLVYNDLEGEILFRCGYEELPVLLRRIVKEKWARSS